MYFTKLCHPLTWSHCLTQNLTTVFLLWVDVFTLFTQTIVMVQTYRNISLTSNSLLFSFWWVVLLLSNSICSVVLNDLLESLAIWFQGQNLLDQVWLLSITWINVILSHIKWESKPREHIIRFGFCSLNRDI